jgi:hypothetical protein
MIDDQLVMFTEERFEPCLVCGEPSSGYHCGAVTCEACKKFFLRSINGEDSKYKCIRNRDCVILRSTRTQCQYCRFKKCKEVGMTTSDYFLVIRNSVRSVFMFKDNAKIRTL